MFSSLLNNNSASMKADTYTSKISLEEITNSYVNAACAVTADGHILAANRAAQVFFDLLPDQANQPNNAVVSLVQKTLDQGRCVTERIMTRAEDETLVFQVNTIPIFGPSNEPLALVLARDMTADRNVVDALVASRELFKDLVSCSSDFAWETDQHGIFTYVSKDGALGFGPADLIGTSAKVLLMLSDDSPYPFDACHPVEDYELWVRTANGEEVFCRICCKPVLMDNAVVAIRGVCRDITEEYKHKVELKRRRRREKLLQGIVDALRTEFNTRRLLRTAAKLPKKALNADYCWVFTTDDRGSMQLAMAYPDTNEELKLKVKDVFVQACKLAEDNLHVEAAGKSFDLIADFTQFRGAVNGAIVMARNNDHSGWTGDERQVVNSVSAHLGIAFHQIKEREILERLSRLDDVTGLRNRRAFIEDLEKRLAHTSRYRRSGVLAFVDVDNFKSVNDILGHKVGDNVLCAMAQILEDGQRAGDMAARIGGDEFVVWLEETDECGSTNWAQRVLAACTKLDEITQGKTPLITVSIGLAAHTPHDPNDVDTLMQRADSAMYSAKKSGKAAFKFATSSRGA